MVQSSADSQTTEALGYAAEGKKFAEANVPLDVSFKDAAKFVAEITPIVGDAMAAKEVYDEAMKDKPDWVKVGILAGAGAVGLVPFFGPAAGKLIKQGAGYALDTAKRVEVDTNAMASGLGSVRMKPQPNLPPAENAAKTQIAGTLPTYKKADTLLTELSGEGTTLDFGAGLGMSKKELGFDTYEPYPKPDFKPDFVSPNDIPSNSYKKVTNLNVLNVVPRDVRDNIVKDIGRVLEPDGRAIITTRGRDVMTAKGKDGPEPMSIITSMNTYQKGFTQPELRSYVTDTLGEGFNVVNNKLGAAGVTVHKLPTENFKEGGTTMEESSNGMDAMLLEEQVDPVSGNTAPLGALPAEVRDDIEVNVSPNEFVVNAATVRYFGQEFFDNLQETAEDGWERIASTGDLPFRDDELEFEEGDDEPRVNFNDGDIVEEGDGLDNMDFVSVPKPVGGGYSGSGGTGVSSTGYDFKTYSNASGNEIRVYFYNGRPLSKIPEGYEEGGVSEETVEQAVATVVSNNYDNTDRYDNRWARQAGVHPNASNKDIFRSANITEDGIDKNTGYWNTNPETWTSSDWASYNNTVGGSFKIPGTDIKIDPAQVLFSSVLGMGSAALGVAASVGFNVGKEKIAKNANAAALSMIQSGDFGGADPRTVLDTAYSTGVILGKITETTPFETWAKTTLNSSKGNFTKIPEVNKSLMNQVRPINSSIGLGWAKNTSGEQLYNAIQLHKSYTRDPSKGLAATSPGGYVIGMIGSLGGGQAGMLADVNGKALRDPNTNAIIRVDAQGNPYVMTGIFGNKKVIIDGKISGAFDPKKDKKPARPSVVIQPKAGDGVVGSDDLGSGADYDDSGISADIYDDDDEVKPEPKTTIVPTPDLATTAGDPSAEDDDEYKDYVPPEPTITNPTPVQKGKVITGDEEGAIGGEGQSTDYSYTPPDDDEESDRGMNKGGLVPRPKNKK